MMRVIAFAAVLLVSVSAGLYWYTVSSSSPEARFVAMSGPEKERMVNEVISRLKAQGYLARIAGFGHMEEGFEILFYNEVDPQVLAIVRDIIGDLPLKIEENARSYTSWYESSPSGEARYVALSDSDRERIVEKVLQELRVRGYTVNQGGSVENFEYRSYGFRITFRYGVDPEVMAIVRKHINGLPLEVVDLILSKPVKP